MHVSSNLVCLKLKYLFSSVLQLKKFSPDGKDQGKGKHRNDINRKFLLGTKKAGKDTKWNNQQTQSQGKNSTCYVYSFSNHATVLIC